MAVGTSPETQPSSTKGTKRGQGWLTTEILSFAALSPSPYASDLIVALVPKTPTCLFFVIEIAE